jgi:hypothetical protein
MWNVSETSVLIRNHLNKNEMAQSTELQAAKELEQKELYNSGYESAREQNATTLSGLFCIVLRDTYVHWLLHGGLVETNLCCYS